MPRKKKPWAVEHMGVTVRLFRRSRTGPVYAELDGHRSTQEGDQESRKGRQSLRTSDKEEAEAIALAIAKKEAARRINPEGAHQPGLLTFGELRTQYLRERGKLLKPARLKFVTRTLDLFAAHLEPNGRPFRIDDFSQTQSDDYATARYEGRIRSKDPRASDAVTASTVRNELGVLSAVCNWGVSFKRNGKRLLVHNPVRDVRLPKEKNARRPVATLERFEAMAKSAPSVEPSGQLRLMLFMAYYTGRRINAICHLRRSDLLVGRDQVRRGLLSIGWDESYADHWPNAILWRPEFDKRGFAFVSPMPAPLMAAIQQYLANAAVLGEAWLFPSLRHEGQPTRKEAADWWFDRCERAAELPHADRGRWHMFRRAWANRFREHAPQDVALAGGWRDLKALQNVYQKDSAASIARMLEAS